jgi:hypothetical protein
LPGERNSAQHSAKHAASGAEYKNRQKACGEGGHSVIYNEGNQGKDQKIQASHHKPPQKFAASLTLARKKSGKKGYNDINPGDADGHDPLGEGKSVEQQGQQKKQSCGEQVGEEQAL